MSTRAAAVALVVLVVAAVVVPAAVARPVEVAAAPQATLAIPVPSAGDVTVALLTIQTKKGKKISPKLTVLQGDSLGPDVSVFGGLRPVKGKKGRYEGIALLIRTAPVPAARPAPLEGSSGSVFVSLGAFRGSAVVTATSERDLYRNGTVAYACDKIRPEFIEKPLKVVGLFGPLPEGPVDLFGPNRVLINVCESDPALGNLLLGPVTLAATPYDIHIKLGLTLLGAALKAPAESVVSATISGPAGSFADTGAGEVEQRILLMRVFDDAGPASTGLPLSEGCLYQPIQQFSPYHFDLKTRSFGRTAQLSSTFVVDAIAHPDPRCAPGSDTAPGPETSAWWCTNKFRGYIGLEVNGTPGGRFQTTAETDSTAALDGADFATATTTFSKQGSRYLGFQYIGSPRTFTAKAQFLNEDAKTNGTTTVQIDTSKPSPESPPKGSPCSVNF